jgi:hypothetical protein
MGKKPTVRIVRNMARSGGTLIGKCIGCMDSVVLLSEVHPANLKVTKPMVQASKWFDLIPKRTLAIWRMGRAPSMLQFISVCQQTAESRGQTLVVRDWSHLDYIGVPFATAGYGFGLGESLESAFEVKQISTVRHPVDQYLSMQSFPGLEDLVPIGVYLKGCAAFAEFAAENGFVRYEDFTEDPDAALRTICDAIGIGFDPGYRDRWHSYTTITGDNPTTGGRSTTAREIRSMPRKAVDGSIMDAFHACSDYEKTCALLGYEM